MAEIKQVLVPDIGSYKDVGVIEVMVKVGDSIKAEDNLLTLETDKAAMDVPSPYDGVVKEVKVKVGDKVSEGGVILLLEVSGAAAAATAAPAAAPAATPAPVAAKAAPAVTTSVQPVQAAGGKGHASPAIRRFARELGVDIAQVKGSGEKSRVTKEDVQNFVKQSLAQPRGAAGGLAVLDMPVVDFAKFGAIETKPLSRIKKISGANLHRNWVTIPHVTQFDEADISEMEAFRKQLGAEYAKQNIKITPLAFLVKAAAAALQQFPDFNASLDAGGENLVLKQYCHIGVAVDTPDGLMVPVLRDVDKKGLVQIAKELGELGARAREKKITAADMQGGCFTISSLGGIGGTAFTPIINAPEVAILGVSRSSMKPVYQDGEFVARLMLPLSLSYDHRVIDGAAAARFTTYLGQVLSDIRRLAL
ncbi:MAG TPA: dihydrolipoyllysine-residue acetyltransferase [Gallionella sp.]|nr:dihydrolipoyllysine-residue acetyltransferase [Gallionella sp.]